MLHNKQILAFSYRTPPVPNYFISRVFEKRVHPQRKVLFLSPSNHLKTVSAQDEAFDIFLVGT